MSSSTPRVLIVHVLRVVHLNQPGVLIAYGDRNIGWITEKDIPSDFTFDSFPSVYFNALPLSCIAWPLSAFSHWHVTCSLSKCIWTWYFEHDSTLCVAFQGEKLEMDSCLKGFVDRQWLCQQSNSSIYVPVRERPSVLDYFAKLTKRWTDYAWLPAQETSSFSMSQQEDEFILINTCQNESFTLNQLLKQDSLDEIKNHVFHYGCPDQITRRLVYCRILGWSNLTRLQKDEFLSLFPPSEPLDEGTLQTIEKDVLRLGRSIPCFARSQALEMTPAMSRLMKILIWYASQDQSIGYVQGMTDLAQWPVALFSDLNETEENEETDKIPYFIHFIMMKQSSHLFRSDERGMHATLQALRALLFLFLPPYFHQLAQADALHLFFCHRWFLTRFQREFHSWDSLLLLDRWISAPVHCYEVLIAFSMLEYLLETELPKQQDAYESESSLITSSSESIWRVCQNMTGQWNIHAVLERAAFWLERVKQTGKTITLWQPGDFTVQAVVTDAVLDQIVPIEKAPWHPLEWTESEAWHIVQCLFYGTT